MRTTAGGRGDGPWSKTEEDRRLNCREPSGQRGERMVEDDLLRKVRTPFSAGPILTLGDGEL
ncbi:MAG: hypothetical protein ISS79_12690 [Phycisphaerae bacterium]|nr:hypothetical protein [Phycisphaerae bacterium]